jgi:hypothetical protein
MASHPVFQHLGPHFGALDAIGGLVANPGQDLIGDLVQVVLDNRVKKFIDR